MPERLIVLSCYQAYHARLGLLTHLHRSISYRMVIIGVYLVSIRLHWTGACYNRRLSHWILIWHQVHAAIAEYKNVRCFSKEAFNLFSMPTLLNSHPFKSFFNRMWTHMLSSYLFFKTFDHILIRDARFKVTSIIMIIHSV